VLRLCFVSGFSVASFHSPTSLTVSTIAFIHSSLSLFILCGGPFRASSTNFATPHQTGQEVYYSTHSFFLSERSIYLVIWNLAADESLSRVPYWLNAIKIHAPTAPIILVATHLDEKKGKEKEVQEMLDQTLSKYKKAHKNLKGVYGVSTQSGKGMEELIKGIEDTAVVVTEQFNKKKPPASWSKLEILLEETARAVNATSSCHTTVVRHAGPSLTY
jgi:hypothetical protein